MGFEKGDKSWHSGCYFNLLYLSEQKLLRGDFMNFKSTVVAAILANALFAQVAFAQNQELYAEVDSEIEQLQVNSPSANSQSRSQGSVVTQTIVVPTQQQAVQKQPETIIEASPLSNSRADSIRRGRQEEELKTESRIVEKLEQSRLEDEKKRASILFGDKFDNLQNVQQAPVQAPPSYIQPQPIIVESNELNRNDIREEVRAALDDEKNVIEPVNEQRYFVATAGIGQYPDVTAIKGNYSLGAGFGNRFDYFLVEGTFTYSNYTMTGLYIQPGTLNTIYSEFDMNQYQGTITAKYQMLGGFVRPVLGGLASYSYRQYVANYNSNITRAGDELRNSHALDLGILAGVDLEFNSKMSYGVELKYLFNMSRKISGNGIDDASAPESFEYYVGSVFARMNF